MTKDIHPNKLNQRDRRRMENIRDRLRSQNVGEDEATRLAMEQVVDESLSGKGGGGQAGGEPQKPVQHGGARRTGSRARESKRKKATD